MQGWVLRCEAVVRNASLHLENPPKATKKACISKTYLCMLNPKATKKACISKTHLCMLNPNATKKACIWKTHLCMLNPNATKKACIWKTHLCHVEPQNLHVEPGYPLSSASCPGLSDKPRRRTMKTSTRTLSFKVLHTHLLRLSSHSHSENQTGNQTEMQMPGSLTVIFHTASPAAWADLAVWCSHTHTHSRYTTCVFSRAQPDLVGRLSLM